MARCGKRGQPDAGKQGNEKNELGTLKKITRSLYAPLGTKRVGFIFLGPRLEKIVLRLTANVSQLRLHRRLA